MLVAARVVVTPEEGTLLQTTVYICITSLAESEPQEIFYFLFFPIWFTDWRILNF